MKETFSLIIGVVLGGVIVWLYLMTQQNDKIAGMPPPNQIPADTEISLYITKNNKFFPADKDGNPLQPCEICTPKEQSKYGAKCENAPKDSNICGSLRNATVNDFTQITFIKTKVNPECGTLIIGNRAYPWPPGCGQ